jgi:hypothetical protein
VAGWGVAQRSVPLCHGKVRFAYVVGGGLPSELCSRTVLYHKRGLPFDQRISLASTASGACLQTHVGLGTGFAV